MKKPLNLISSLGIILFVCGAKAQVAEKVPAAPEEKPFKTILLEPYNPYAVFGTFEDNTDDPEQEAEIEEAARIESNGSLQQKKAAKVTATVLSDFYKKDTLLLSANRSEILKNNIWRSPGVAYDKFMGVTAYSNSRGGKYQCTEVTHRFLKDIYGVPTKVGQGMGHANVLVQNFMKVFGDKTYKYQGKNIKMNLRQNAVSTEPPAVGSVINFQSGKFGHIAVVRFVEVIDEDTVRIYLFEQHGFPKHAVGAKKPIRSVDFNRSASGQWSGERVLGIGQPLFWLNFTGL